MVRFLEAVTIGAVAYDRVLQIAPCHDRAAHGEMLAACAVAASSSPTVSARHLRLV